MARQWYVIEDRQTPGAMFGGNRLYTAEEWLDQAIDWLEHDQAFDEDESDDSYWQSPERFREIWSKEIQKDPEELIKFIDSYWDITLVEQGVDDHDYYKDVPIENTNDVEGCSVMGNSESKIPYQLVSMATMLRDFFALSSDDYLNKEHLMLTDIADYLYNSADGAFSDHPEDNLLPEFKVIFDNYGADYFKQVLDDMSAIDSQVTSTAKEDELYDDYQDRLKSGITASTRVTATEVVEAEDINPGNIYDYAVKLLPADDIDHHESDLYIRKTPESTALINKMQYKDSGLLTTFRSNIAPHDTWYELPFCYTPDWRSKMMSSLPIQNATTVKASRWYYREPMSEEELKSLENDILAIPGCDKVEIHTDGMEELGQLIVMPFYGDIHFDESITDPYKRVGKYSEEQKAMKQAVLEVAKDHGLTRTGDRIEDYGSCYYMVFNTNKPKTDKYDEY